MLRHAQFQIVRQLDARAYRPFERDWVKRRGVADLRNIISECKPGLEEKEKMPRDGAIDWLNFHVTAHHVARISGTSGACSSRSGGLRKGAAAQIWLVVRWSESRIHEPANPIVREESRRARVVDTLTAGKRSIRGLARSQRNI